MTAIVLTQKSTALLSFIKSTWLVVALGLGVIVWLYEPPTYVEMEPVLVVADQCVEDFDD